MTVLNTPLKLNIRQQIKSLCAVSVLLAEIHSDEVTYKIHQKTPVQESFVNKVAGHTKKVGPRPWGGTRTQQPVVGTWGETLCETQGWNSGVGP